MASNNPYPYDIAISYAREDHTYAEALAKSLQHSDIKIFYDQYEKSTLWGKNLYDYLSDVYQNKARYCVILFSQHYTAKIWTTHERQAAQNRAIREHEEYILPIRLDTTQFPDHLQTLVWLNWHEETIETITDAIIKKLGKKLDKTAKEWENAEEWLEKGRVFSDLERYEDAVQAYGQALQLDLTNITAHIKRSFALIMLDRYEEALIALEQSIQLDQANTAAYAQKGLALNQLSRYKEALVAIEQALQLDPTNTLAYRQKGFALNQLGRYEEAVVTLDQLIQLDPLSAIAYARKGFALLQLGQYEEALAALKQSLRLNPTDDWVLRLKGAVLYKLDRYE